MKKLLSVALRFSGFYLIWLALIGLSPLDAVAGLPAAGLATWVSLKLMPPSGNRISFGKLVVFAGQFLWESVIAGFDVAWRVFQVRMQLNPGMVKVPAQLPEGAARTCFTGLASLQPGTLACGIDEDGQLLFHCLDTTADVEAALMRTQNSIADLRGVDH